MRRKWIAGSLGIAALAVTVENVVFFRSLGSSPPVHASADDAELEEDPDEETRTELDTSRNDPGRESAEAPEPSVPRSPFLTQAEALQLAWRPAGGDPENDLEPPRLDGTLWSADRRVAWLGGLPRSEGDGVGSFRLERIETGSVSMRLDGQEIRVALPEGRSVRSDEPEAENENDREEQIHGR